MKKFFRPTLALVFLVASCLTLPAAGHDMPVKRSAIVQIHQDRIEILLMYSESPGARSKLLLAKYDLDKDGRIDGAKERMLALPEMSKRIAVGLGFEVPGEAPEMASPEIKVTKDKGGGLSAALLVRYDLPKMTPGQSRSIRIRLFDREGNAPLTALVEAGEGLVMQQSEVAPNDGHETSPFTVLPGGDVSLTVDLPALEAKPESPDPQNQED